MTFPKCAIPWSAWRIHTISILTLSPRPTSIFSQANTTVFRGGHCTGSRAPSRTNPAGPLRHLHIQRPGKKKHPIFLYVSLSIRISIFMRAVTEDGTDGAVTASLNSDAVANGDDNRCSCIQIRLQTRGFRWGRLELHTARLQLHIWAIRRGPDLQPFRRESYLWSNKNLLESAYLHQGRINNHTWRIH